MESFSPENPKFHETLREKRNALHLTQNELAKQVGVTRQTMHLIENNKYNPTIKVCLLLAQALQTSIDQLFWMEEQK